MDAPNTVCDMKLVQLVMQPVMKDLSEFDLEHAIFWKLEVRGAFEVCKFSTWQVAGVAGIGWRVLTILNALRFFHRWFGDRKCIPCSNWMALATKFTSCKCFVWSAAGSRFYAASVSWSPWNPRGVWYPYQWWLSPTVQWHCFAMWSPCRGWSMQL